MTQPDPQNKLNFLQSALEHIKDMEPPLRFTLVILILLIFVWLFNIAIPADFVWFLYIALGGGLLVYLGWEFQQHKTRQSERQDEFRDKHDQREHERALEKERLAHEREMKRLENEKATAPETPSETQDKAPSQDMRADYLNWVLTQVSELQLLGIDPKAVGSERDTRLHLSKVYTALLTADSKEKEEVWRPNSGSRQPKPLSALAQLDRRDRLVLLGDPGSGKSTFVNFVAMCLAGEALAWKAANLELLTAALPDDKGEDEEKPQPWSWGALLPLPVVLRDFAARGLPAPGHPASAKHLWRFLQEELTKAELGGCVADLQAAFKAGEGLLLLDGLDEVPEANQRRDQIKQVVESFARQYGDSRILVTSRTYAYQQQNWQLNGFQDTQLLPFSPGQIHRFIDGWYAHAADLRDNLTLSQAHERAETLKAAIFSRPRLLELAERPLLLTLMASLHAWRMGELPRHRHKLYEEAVELLLDRWENRQKVLDGRQKETMLPSLAEWLNTDRDKVRELLNRLAYEAHKAQPDLAGTADIPQKELLAGLMALNENPKAQHNQLIVHLRDRAGLLSARGEGVYTFPHRTFQEYLAACYLADSDPDYPYSLAQLAREKPNRWREVLLLAGAKTGRNNVWFLAQALYPERLAAKLAANEQAVWGTHLAGQMLVETIDPDRRLNPDNQERLERIQAGLRYCLGTKALPPTERALAGATLAVLGDTRDEVMTVEKMPFCLIPGGDFYMGEGKGAGRNNTLQRDYWMSQYPITNSQFMAFAKAGGYEEKRYWPEAVAANYWQPGQFKGRWDSEWRTEPHNFGRPYNLPNHPVVGMTWYEALAFTRWLTELWQGSLPEGYGVTLPSEAEWEKAARGGLDVLAQSVIAPAGEWLPAPVTSRQSNLDTNRAYPWTGSFAANNANTKESGINHTCAVGCFPDGASPYGCLDMSGNAWEWTRSLADGREDLTADPNNQRVLRGGAYYSEPDGCRCSSRPGYYPYRRHYGRGFRVAVSPFFTLPSGPSAL